MIASHSWAGPIAAAPDGSHCDQFGHTPGGVNGNGWVFCSRCGTSLWKAR